MHDQTTTGSPKRPIPARDRQQVAMLSAAVLAAARDRGHEDRAEFAARAGLALAVVNGAEKGTCPAWQLPYDEFTALADAVGWLDPSQRELFETAAACDLLLACLLDGDQAMATEVLADDDTRDVTMALLRRAITGNFGYGWGFAPRQRRRRHLLRSATLKLPEIAVEALRGQLRTSFVSMMSYQGVPVEEIARLAGHASSRATEVIYRRELRPVITTGAEVMDQIFRPRRDPRAAADAAG